MPKLLVVDDDADVREVIIDIFQETCDVISAANPRTALELAFGESPDIILMDVELGDAELNGYDLTRQIKAHEATSSIPIIILTGAVLLGSREKGYAAGCDDHWEKGTQIQQLMHKVAQLLK